METFTDGMKISGIVFQKIINDMLGDLQPKCAVAYINNITIFNKNMEQHLIDVGNVFQRLDLVNLKINLDKFHFA